MSLRNFVILILLLGGIVESRAQQVDLYPYFPSSFEKDNWKGRVDVFASERSGSDSFTNAFFDEITKSGYLSPEMKNEQIQKFNGDILTATQRSVGGGAYFKSKKVFYYVGVEHQYVLDTRINENVAKLLLLGNEPFAGETLQIGSSDYTSIYFNRLMGGVGYELDKGEMKHTFFGKIGFASGQNYEEIKLHESSFYTHPDGDYLDVAVAAETRIGDTVWAAVFDINGLGASLDISYTLSKEKDYYLNFTAKNMGFISWNKNTYVSSVDTAFRFEGVGTDTTTSGEIPDDYSYSSLRDLIFTNAESSSFTSSLPIILSLSGGKYFSGDQFYTGINFNYYPTMAASYYLEVFGTWNYKNKFQLTPIFSYSSFNRFNVGLSVSVNIASRVYLQAGTAFLDSYISRDSYLASGGFLRAVFVW